MPDEEVTTAQAAEMLECSERTIRRMIERGTISARVDRVDPSAQKGVYKIPRSEIERIQKQQAASS